MFAIVLIRRMIHAFEVRSLEDKIQVTKKKRNIGNYSLVRFVRLRQDPVTSRSGHANVAEEK